MKQMKNKKISLDHKTFEIGVNKYENMLLKKVKQIRKPLWEKWRYDKKEWIKEVTKLDSIIRVLKVKKFNYPHGQNSKTIKNKINEYHKSLYKTQKIFLSACERETDNIRKNEKLSQEEKESKLLGITNKTADLIIFYIKYYDQKIKSLEKKLNLISCINKIPKYIKDHEQKLLYGLCHFKYKEIHNHQTQNNLFKKGKISK